MNLYYHRIQKYLTSCWPFSQSSTVSRFALNDEIVSWIMTHICERFKKSNKNTWKVIFYLKLLPDWIEDFAQLEEQMVWYFLHWSIFPFEHDWSSKHLKINIGFRTVSCWSEFLAKKIWIPIIRLSKVWLTDRFNLKIIVATVFGRPSFQLVLLLFLKSMIETKVIIEFCTF